MRVPFVHRDGRRGVLGLGRLPHPWAVAQGIASYRPLPLAQRFGVGRVARALAALDEAALRALDALDARAWLTGLRQGPSVVEWLWRPIALATMNAEPERASAALFAVVLREIFLRGPRASALVLPGVALSKLYVDRAVSTIRRLGGTVRTGTRIETIARASDGNFLLEPAGATSEVPTSEGRIEARTAILAVPPWEAEGLLASIPRACEEWSGAFEASEIASLHVWTRRPVSREPMIGLLGTRLQWVFPKSAEVDGTFYATCTISAARGDGDEDRGAELVRTELPILFPHLRPDDVLRVKTVRERAATFVPRPGLEAIRPEAETPIHGLFLAGDWTATHLPATIEGAVRSGERAANAVLHGVTGNGAMRSEPLAAEVENR